MKSGFWRTDWFLGLVVAALFALAYAAVLPLQNRLLVRVDWPIYADLGGIALAAVYLVALLPRQRAVPAAAASAALLAFLFVASLDYAALLLLVGYAAFASKQLVAAQRPQAPATSALRYLALAYQAQGRLIAAWQQFRRVPLSDAVRADLEALALEFEKDGQARKADEVRRHLQGGPAVDEEARAKAPAAKPVVKAPAESGKPRIGAFEIEAELGRSAMAIVYLGRDPLLGRQLAIKTLRLEQELEAEGVEEIKARLFSGVRAAGGLSHPNIVTIYDTGEERDVCYIAMEFLRGGDLLRFAAPENLLPAEQAVSITARVADALGYAHREGVVHHDVRPGNILYDAATDTVKVTDFGIARLGGAPTPYASPEQLAGAAVDGRSDLYSLGITLHQLLCGRLPQAGLIDADVPPGIAELLERALAKNPAERFHTAEELAGALRAAPLARFETGAVDFHL